MLDISEARDRLLEKRCGGMTHDWARGNCNSHPSWKRLGSNLSRPHSRSLGQIFGAGGALIQKKNKEKEKGKGKEERREKRKKERGEFNLEDPMFPI